MTSKEKEKKIRAILREADEWGMLVEQGREKADEHGFPDPETPEDHLAWLIDEWTIQSNMAWDVLKRAPGDLGGSLDELNFRVEKASKLADFVNRLLDLGLQPKWPWPKKK